MSSSDLIRVRDNQRRSRARRKEYIQELEVKLRRWESLGAQASLEIQAAARNVSEENARLRVENASLKDENESLRERLRMDEKAVTSKIHVPTYQEYHQKSVERYDQIPEACDARMDLGRARPNIGNHVSNLSSMGQSSECPSRCPKLPTSMPLQTPASGLHHGLQNHLNVTEDVRDVHSTPGSAGYTPRPTSNKCISIGDDTSSCEYAAHIITSMRADVSTDDVGAELGCGKNVKEWRDCKVDNARFFAAVDQYT